MHATIRVITLAVAASLLASSSTTAQTERASTISVDGIAEVRVVPNQVILTVGIETFDVDLATAKRDNDSRVNALLAVAKSFDVAPQDVQTEFLSIQPHYKDRNDRGNFLRYIVRKTVVITLRDISKFESLLSGLLESGVNYVHGVEFRTTNLQDHRDEAETLAVAAARDRADAIAQGLGRKVGRAQTINVSSANWSSSYGHWGQASRRQGPQNLVVETIKSPVALDGPTAPGRSSLIARVRASFILED